jgi:hypothetical protein
MFYEQARAALDGNRSEGWVTTAKVLGYSEEQLMTKLEQEALSFEECILLMRASKSPELLRYVLDQFSSALTKVDGGGTSLAVTQSHSRLN